MADIDYMKNAMYDHFKSYGILPLLKDEAAADVYNLITNDVVIENGDDMAYLYYGSYYNNARNYEKTIKYWMMSAELNNSWALYNLAAYYGNERDIDKSIEYYNMSANLGNISAAKELVIQYERKMDYDNMIKNCVIVFSYDESKDKNKYQKNIECVNKCRILQKIVSYYEKQNDYDNIIKYYLMGLATDDQDIFGEFIEYMKHHHESFLQMYASNKELFEKYDLSNLLIYYMRNNYMTSEIINMILENDFSDELLKLIKRLLMEKIDIMDLHFNYSMEGKGFMEAKKDFIDRLV